MLEVNLLSCRTLRLLISFRGRVRMTHFTSKASVSLLRQYYLVFSNTIIFPRLFGNLTCTDSEKYVIKTGKTCTKTKTLKGEIATYSKTLKEK